MEMTLRIPDDLVESMRAALGEDLERAAIERLAIDGYRSGKLSRYQVQRLLGFATRFETEGWLGQNKTNINFDLQDLNEDRKTLERILAE